ncbi:DUF2577 family protein [Paenibacillus agilis]|uniref:DUF2577 domain-containing protein n=1 Tax=Paenibacillus agilis TaxID=3020863 RepID=A0A559IW96_9BACL|nr:DUF2577 family protein [Paenibacillus agilis]TVX91907.1 DUF2577 domain-containing protein [Paenibacillus agilis]
MLSEKIKRISMQANTASVPAAVMFGQVQKVTPIHLLVDSRFVIEGDMVIMSRDLPELLVGDTVVLLRNNGGQQFVVLGRL